MPAIVVEQQHVVGGLGVAGQDVPACHRQIGGFGQEAGIRQPACGDDDHVRVQGAHIVRIGEHVEAHFDAQPLALFGPPFGDPDQLAAPAGPGRQADLPAGIVRRLEQHHAMAAFGRHPGGLQTGRAGADHRHLVRRPVGSGDDVRHGCLAAGRRIVDAQRLVPLVDPVEAIGGADAGANLGLPPLRHLGRDMRVGDMGAGHADHIQLALGDSVAGRRHIVDAGRVEHREFGLRPHLAAEIQVRRRRSSLGSG